MANEKQYPMTAEGKRKLEEELVKLETETRKEIVERIKIARDFGDLSENAEYDSAKEEQAFLEGRISTLKSMIRNAVIISEDETDNSVVSLGKTVTFVEIINGKPSTEEESYTIVGSAEADPMEFRISNESPIAKGLLGRGEGEEVAIQTPGGEMKVKILSIK
ncbi:transcription elongation factor GreA [Lysinibacillus sp. FSL H8-0500]|uniref:Transcription elongation factor GreA n=1 Tax=Lysinibacillus macroides TaxID=33935 RepID=A0A0M9DHH7_9BACI|nr:transcription elongation factor GreA [Lysinibacillus macroides]KOY80999.1 transcription elongation factor GreA [Lysinibacillus macroides]QPR68854.1 transcription elongation factor GreA [Lysinibacillus macroides]